MKFLVYSKYSINATIIMIIIILSLLLFKKHAFFCFLKPPVSANDKDYSEISSRSHSRELILEIYFFHNASSSAPLVSHHSDCEYLSEPSRLLIKWSLKKILGICFNCGLKSFPRCTGLQKCLEVKNEVNLNKVSSF